MTTTLRLCLSFVLLACLALSLQAQTTSTTPAHTVSGMTTAKKFIVAVSPKDAGGNPTTLDAGVQVSVNNTAVCTSSFAFGQWTISAVAPGTCVVTLAAASGGNDVSETITAVITQPPAVTLGVTITGPVNK